MPNLTRLQNDHLTIEISSLGAELQSVTTSDGHSFLWNGDAAFWGGRSPILFPIVGKAPHDTVLINGKPYPMVQHGIARRREFVLEQTSANTCRYRLTSNDDTKAIYPFDFSLALDYTLHNTCLTISASVTNGGTEPMPYGIGFHPAFLWPLPGADDKPHTIVLDNGAEPELLRLRAGLLDDTAHPSPFKAGELTLNANQYEDDAMIFPNGIGTGLTYQVEGGPSLHFTFENLPNLALWQKPGAPFICIEPWHGMAAQHGKGSEVKDRPYSVILPPGDTARYGFTVTVSA
ncbi:aldose 1-epimerase family protein [Rhizobium sp.]|jgi:galactose mutarotase-like enzyme|uniref:aldose 1-epimerase family protein n=1 Tax=Rhizobium sp. TaxID=391 RepID=UPI000E875F29|nr:aldose epimerase [Rhizobium sp.]